MMKKQRTNQSNLHKDTLKTVRECFPEAIIQEEVALKINNKTLFLDIYLPKQGLAFEADGEQHFKYNQHFHGSFANFRAQKKNDELKEEYCKEENIALIHVRFDEKIDRDILMQKILDSLNKGEEN